MISRLLVIFLQLTLFAGVASAVDDNTVTISGSITRKNGKPVSGAVVAAVKDPPNWSTFQTSKLLTTTRTDRGGRFALVLPVSALRDVRLTAVGRVKKSTRGDGTIVHEGSDVRMTGVPSSRTDNVIVVPNEFVPAPPGKWSRRD